MSKRLFLFLLWSAALTLAVAVSVVAAWSPFADASGHHEGPHSRDVHHGGHGGAWFYGPMHK